MKSQSIEEVHMKIVRDACDIANADPWVYETFGGPIFIPGHDLRTSFIITWDPAHSFSGEEKIKKMHVIGKDALHKSLKRNEKLFVGLIIGLARKGENYFRIFEE